MSIAIDYLQLRQAFPHIPEGVAFSVTMNQLATLWFCTPRNAKLMIKKMEQRDWLRFTPGQGRGHASSLTFQEPREDLLLTEAQTRLTTGNLPDALHLLEQFGEGTRVKEKFLERINRYFGYSVEATERGRFETLRFPTVRSVQTLDPALAFYAFDVLLVEQVMDTLVEYDASTGTCRPRLAHAWESNAEATRWVFYLRKGVRFHHGRECTADDVVFSLNRLQDEDRFSQASWFTRFIGQAEALDRYSVLFTIPQPNQLLPAMLASTVASILPADQPEQFTQPGTLPCGTGSFRVTQRTPALCVLEAFDEHFRGRVQTDRIEIFTLTPEQVKEWNSWNAGQIVVQTGEAELPSLPDWNTLSFLYPGTSLLTCNLSKPGPLQHVSLREAIDLILDRTKMIEELGGPRLYPSTGFQYRPERSGTERGETEQDGLERGLPDQSGVDQSGQDQCGTDQYGMDQYGMDLSGTDQSNADQNAMERNEMNTPSTYASTLRWGFLILLAALS